PRSQIGRLPQRQTEIEDFARRTVIGVLLAVLIVALAYLCWRGVEVLLLAFAGMLFAVFLSALSDWLSQFTRLPYHWALTVVVVSLVALTAGIGWLVGNQLARQILEMSQRLPEFVQAVRNHLKESPWGTLLLEQEAHARDSLGQLAQFFDIRGLVAGVSHFL